MLRSLQSGVSGIQQFQEEMDVIGNNIANVNTTGFKAARAEFADTFNQTLRNATAASGSLQIGTGVTTASVRNVYSQGAISKSGVPTDLAISGSGFFLVRNAADGAQYATRAGAFQWDESGYLVTQNGMRVQGFSNNSLTARGDLRSGWPPQNAINRRHRVRRRTTPVAKLSQPLRPG